MHHQRPVQQRGHHATGKTDIAAHAQHHIGSLAPYRRRALPERLQQAQRQQQFGDKPLAAQSGEVHPGHGVTARRYEPGFHAAGNAHPNHAPAQRTQVIGHGERRENVPARSAGHDHDGLLHGFASVTARPPDKAADRVVTDNINWKPLPGAGFQPLINLNCARLMPAGRASWRGSHSRCASGWRARGSWRECRCRQSSSAAASGPWSVARPCSRPC